MVRVCIGCHQVFGCSGKDSVVECRVCEDLCEAFTAGLSRVDLSEVTGGICSTCWLNWKESRRQKSIMNYPMDASAEENLAGHRNSSGQAAFDPWHEQAVGMS